MPISGVPIDWCAPPSGASVMPDGVPTTMKRAVLVAGVVQRIEAAADEGIIERADGQQPLAEQRVRQPAAPTASGTGSSRRCRARCAGPSGSSPSAAATSARARLNTSSWLAMENRPRRFTHGPRLVDTVTSGDVVTMRSASGPPARAISSSTRPKPACVDICPLASILGNGIDGNARRLQPPPALLHERHALQVALDLGRRQRQARRTGPIPRPG